MTLNLHCSYVCKIFPFFEPQHSKLLPSSLKYTILYYSKRWSSKEIILKQTLESTWKVFLFKFVVCKGMCERGYKKKENQ